MLSFYFRIHFVVDSMLVRVIVDPVCRYTRPTQKKLFSYFGRVHLVNINYRRQPDEGAEERQRCI